MQYDRVFTFGCSFTQFFWPTWADIIETDLGLPTQHWGLCGLGNVGIAHRLLEADAIHKFTPNDLIIVLWSTWSRECRFVRGQWQCAGNIIQDANTLYKKQFVKDHWSIDNDLVKNVGAITMSNRSFPITYQATMDRTAEIEDKDVYSDSILYNTFKDNIEFIRSFDIFQWDNFDLAFDDTMTHVDNHPDIKAHLEFAEEYICSKLNRTMKQSTKTYYMQMHNKVVEMGKSGILKKEIRQWSDIEIFFKNHFDFDGNGKRLGVPFNK